MKKKPDILVVLAVVLGLGIALSSVEFGQNSDQEEVERVSTENVAPGNGQQLPDEQRKQAADGHKQSQLATTIR